MDGRTAEALVENADTRAYARNASVADRRLTPWPGARHGRVFAEEVRRKRQPLGDARGFREWGNALLDMLTAEGQIASCSRSWS